MPTDRDTGSIVTLKDLAARTGFDKSTISRALRGDPTLSIRPESLQSILAAAADLGYRPDPAARRLRSARSFTLGIVVPSLQNQLHAQIVEGIQKICTARGYTLLIAFAESEATQPQTYRQLVERQRVDGLLVLTLQNEEAHLPLLRRLKVPVVMVNRRSAGFHNWVVVDEHEGAVLATEHLLHLGHRAIAMLAGEQGRYNAGERLRGYRDALERANVRFDPDLVETAGYSFDGGARAMNALLDRRRGAFTAVFAVTLMAAAGALNALTRRGVPVPGEISLVAFHDGLLAEAITPALTTVAYPLTELGESAANGMIDLLEGRADGVQRVFTGGRIVARDSTAAPPRGPRGGGGKAGA